MPTAPFFSARFASLPLLLSMATAACSSGGSGGGGNGGGGPPPAAPQTFVGAIDGTDAAAALVASNGSVLLFFCGGAQSYATLTHWLRGSGVSLAGSFTLDDATWKVTGAPASGGGFSGTIDPGGNAAPMTWSLRPVAAGTLEGLYDANAAGGLPTLIVSQPSASAPAAAQGAFRLSAGSGSIEQVVPLMPLEWVANQGIPVNVLVSGSNQEVFLTRAQP